jgi:ADP-heptose:LPS heptosyltransferase
VSADRPVALVLRALGLGDLLAGVPALRAVRRALPEHHLALATDPSLAGLVRLVGGIDQLVPARGLAPLRCRGRWTWPSTCTARDR